MSERADDGGTSINKIVASVGERHSNESKEGLSLVYFCDVTSFESQRNKRGLLKARS